MSFTLQITFRGMCFYVPDPAEKRMHVLMPATGDHAHGMDPHYARLSFPRRPLDPVSLDGRELDLSGIGPVSGTLALPPGVANLGTVAGVKVDREQLGPAPRASVAARLRLPPWADAKQGPSAGWKFSEDSPVQRLTNLVLLTWTLPGESLDLHIRPLVTGKPDTSLTLEPVDGVIELEVSYLPAQEPEDPKPGEPAPHFECHYALFQDAMPRPVPRLHELVEGNVGGGSPYTCLTAGGPPGP